MQKLVGVCELAEILGVSTHLIYKMTSRKGLPYYKVGGRCLFDLDRIEQWLKEHEVTPSVAS